jgi:hypothetical protein
MNLLYFNKTKALGLKKGRFERGALFFFTRGQTAVYYDAWCLEALPKKLFPSLGSDYDIVCNQG